MFKTCCGLATFHLETTSDMVCFCPIAKLPLSSDPLSVLKQSSTTLMTTGSGKGCVQAATEAIGVTKGKTRTVKVDHHGWKGKISVGLGLSSVHFRANSE